MLNLTVEFEIGQEIIHEHDHDEATCHYLKHESEGNINYRAGHR